MPSFGERIQHAWNAFLSRDPTNNYNIGYGNSIRPDHAQLTGGRERSIVTAVITRIAIDCAAIDIEHVKTDENGKYKETLNTPLNNVLTLDANLDQTAFALKEDMVITLCDTGVIAIVPTDTTINPENTDSYEIKKLRVGKIVEWYPAHVKVRLYNERDGKKHDIILPKKKVGIVENPLYAVMNEPNSILQRLIRTFNRLDLINDQNTSGKLDLIIQLPYSIRSEGRKRHAEERRKDIENQLTGSKYGIAYVDATEKITQLNRAVDNQLWQEAQDLTAMLYNQLGLTQSVFDGTADEATMLNYYSRTIDPIMTAITTEMQRKFISLTGRSQGQAIRYFRDPFRLVPADKLADIADKLTRNEIASSNEMRSEIGWKPVDNPAADELRNKNLNKQDGINLASTNENKEEQSKEVSNKEEISNAK